MTDPIRVYVGSDEFQKAAGMERVLEHSIRSRTNAPVQIVFMRAGSPGFEVSPSGADGSWAIGHGPGEAWSGHGWGTDFSCFRFAIPELAGWRGRAIYLDVDQIVLGDIADLFATPQSKPWVCRYVRQMQWTDVSVIDCEPFEQHAGWPRIVQMKWSGRAGGYYVDLLRRLDMVGPGVPPAWNRLDFEGLTPDTKLAHFTTVPTQPWRPYPKTNYLPIQADWEALWRREHEAAHA